MSFQDTLNQAKQTKEQKTNNNKKKHEDCYYFKEN